MLHHNGCYTCLQMSTCSGQKNPDSLHTANLHELVLVVANFRAKLSGYHYIDCGFRKLQCLKKQMIQDCLNVVKYAFSRGYGLKGFCSHAFAS